MLQVDAVGNTKVAGRCSRKYKGGYDLGPFEKEQ
jgi:hypothetical protein